MKHDYIINGENIILRPLNENDLESVVTWRNKDSIRKWFISNELITIEEQTKWYEDYLKIPNDYIFIIEECNDLKQAVGIAAIYNVDDERAEFGRLFIGVEEAIGKNIGSEVVQLLCKFAFDDINLNKIYLNVFDDNEIAINIYQKCGFRICYRYRANNKILIRMELNR